MITLFCIFLIGMIFVGIIRVIGWTIGAMFSIIPYLFKFLLIGAVIFLILGLI